MSTDSKPTMRDLMARARTLIEQRSVIAHDVAAENGQMFNNVRHMNWFVRAVARHLTETTEKWGHLHIP